MIARLILAAALLLAASFARAEEAVARIVYIGVEDDALYQPRLTYTGIVLRDLGRPVDGARLAVRNARILSRALGIRFELEERLLAPDEAAAPVVAAALKDGAVGVLLDLPEALMADALAASRPPDAALFNLRHRDPRWRGEDCAPDLFHTMPSLHMLADALAQHLKALRWSRVLLLHGSAPDDAPALAAARRAIVKFGLETADERAFELTNDPRRRDLANILLLTGGARYDVIWLVDTEGEFGRHLPYATASPRPVVGSAGLTPQAWHRNYERHGGPQLNQRFKRMAKRDMTSEDWAAWAAAGSLIESVARTRSAERGAVVEHLRSGALSMDLYKGVPGSYRPWNGQLRQPILLATTDAVIAWAPFEGFEHRENELDTLGRDRAESACVPAR